VEERTGNSGKKEERKSVISVREGKEKAVLAKGREGFPALHRGE